jgi:hypothetical protein
MTTSDVLHRLRRTDKHFLAAGDGALFDPPHPIWLDRPGFWDEARVFLQTVKPLFTLTLTRPDGREVPLAQRTREWTPAELRAAYSAGPLEVEEHRVVLPGGRFVAEYRITNTGEEAAALVAVAWTAQESADLVARDRIGMEDNALAFALRTRDAQGRCRPVDLACLLALRAAADEAPPPAAAPPGGDTDPSSPPWAVYESQHQRLYPNPPHWETAPFRDHWRRARGLAGELRMAPSPPPEGQRGLVYMGLSCALDLEPGRTAVLEASFQATPSEPGLRPRAISAPPHAMEDPPAPGTAPETSRTAWRRFFADAPSLECSDPHLAGYFPYRWYGLRLNFIDPAGNYRHPTCAEGIAYFHCPISYSAWCHARELRWLPDPARARGVLRTFLDHQREDGSIPGRVYLEDMSRPDFYFADWGGSVLAVDEVHPDPGFLEAAYGPLARFGDFMDRTRDAEGSGLYDVRDPYETGQETMSRYTAVDPEADRQHFEYRLRLKGVDLTVYMYRLRRALARISAGLGRWAKGRKHDAVADRIGDAVRADMWDPETGMFSDVDPRTGRRTGIKAAVCFYPYLTDIAGPEHLPGLARNLFDPASFWTEHPVPSTAADDPTFSAEAVWKGVRQNCPWSGRVWPMTNSHVVDALGRAATTLDPGLRDGAAELLGRYVRMLHFEGDPARPNCFEHYSPRDGRACVYRGIDDYQHSWINDLLIRWAAGFRPREDGGFVVDPLPLGLERLRLERLPYRGRRIGIAMDGERVRVEVDGERVAEGLIGEAVAVPAHGRSVVKEP